MKTAVALRRDGVSLRQAAAGRSAGFIQRISNPSGCHKYRVSHVEARVRRIAQSAPAKQKQPGVVLLPAVSGNADDSVRWSLVADSTPLVRSDRTELSVSTGVRRQHLAADGR